MLIPQIKRFQHQLVIQSSIIVHLGYQESSNSVMKIFCSKKAIQKPNMLTKRVEPP